MSYRTMLRDHAYDQYGYVTTNDAADLGVPAVELRKLAARGALTQIGYGLYRVKDVPRSSRDQFAEAVLRVGPDAFLTHDAVLALHGLGLVNPTVIRVGTPHRTRARLPRLISVIHRRLPPEDLTSYEGIPSTTVARAIRDCRGMVMDERLRDAIRDAEKEGLVNRREAATLRRVLNRPARPAPHRVRRAAVPARPGKPGAAHQVQRSDIGQTVRADSASRSS